MTPYIIRPKLLIDLDRVVVINAGSVETRRGATPTEDDLTLLKHYPYTLVLSVGASIRLTSNEASLLITKISRNQGSVRIYDDFFGNQS